MACSLALFIHGLAGSASETWGKFPELIAADSEISSLIKIGFYEYPTELLRFPFCKKLPPIQYLARGLRTEINYKYPNFDNVFLVCHSLGGLVARQYLVEEIKNGRCCATNKLLLFATPNLGAELAKVGKCLSWKHSQLKQLCKGSEFLDSLNDDWHTFKMDEKIFVKYVIGGQDKIVTEQSSKFHWGTERCEVVINRGHIDIVKPDNPEDLSFLIFKQILKEQPLTYKIPTVSPEYSLDSTKLLPTFEIGICTEGSPFQMQCSGDIIRGIDSAVRVVEEIELDTKSTDKIRFNVRVTAIERIRSYLDTIHTPKGEDIEIKHKLRMVLANWEQNLDDFRNGVEFILWHPAFRKTSYIDNSRSAAKAICGLSKHCFDIPKEPVSCFLWYGQEQETTKIFYISVAVKDFMETGYHEDDHTSIDRKGGLSQYKAYNIGVFFPDSLHEYVLPNILIYVSNQKIKGASQVIIDKYLDVSQWRWSIGDPNRFVNWK
jgi:hypothetical protein